MNSGDFDEGVRQRAAGEQLGERWADGDVVLFDKGTLYGGLRVSTLSL